LSVDFSSAGSSDPEGQPLAYTWTFGDGQTSTQANPTHVYDTPGQYTARLAVSDGTNTTQSSTITISVGEPPEATISSPATGTLFSAGEAVAFSGTGTDPDDGTLPASAFRWNVDLLKDSTATSVSVQSNSKTGSYTVPTTGVDFSGNTRYRITLTVTDANGLTDTDSVIVQPRKVNLTFNGSPAGTVIYVDGAAKTTPFTLDALVGFQHSVDARNQVLNGRLHTLDTWSDGGAQLHTITVPNAAATYTATMKEMVETAPPAFVQGNAHEASSGTTNVTSFNSNNTAGNLIVAYVIWGNQSTVSLSDTRGNTYAPAGARRTWDGSSSSQVFYAKNVAGGANAVTAQFSSAISGWAVVYIHEYSGVDKVNPFDAEVAAVGTSTRTMDSGPLTTAGAALLFNAGASGNAVTAPGPDYITRSTAFGNRTQDRNTYASGTYNATMTSNVNAWVSHLVAFRSAVQ
jgi:hypothetical protein